MTALFADLEEHLPEGASLFRGQLSACQQVSILDLVAEILEAEVAVSMLRGQFMIMVSGV